MPEGHFMALVISCAIAQFMPQGNSLQKRLFRQSLLFSEYHHVPIT